jgi:hypothetical protein
LVEQGVTHGISIDHGGAAFGKQLCDSAFA